MATTRHTCAAPLDIVRSWKERNEIANKVSLNPLRGWSGKQTRSHKYFFKWHAKINSLLYILYSSSPCLMTSLLVDIGWYQCRKFGVWISVIKSISDTTNSNLFSHSMLRSGLFQETPPCPRPPWWRCRFWTWTTTAPCWLATTPGSTCVRPAGRSRRSCWPPGTATVRSMGDDSTSPSAVTPPSAGTGS